MKMIEILENESLYQHKNPKKRKNMNGTKEDDILERWFLEYTMYELIKDVK